MEATTKTKSSSMLTARGMSEIALLTTLITVTAMFKIPSLFPGVEFQLSAPIAVAICVVFGFKKYITAGILSSLIGLLLGTQNILNVAIAMQFRLIVGLILFLAKNHMLAIILCGPIASIIARLSLVLILGKTMSMAIIMAGLPGFIFTAIMSPILTKVFQKGMSFTSLKRRKEATNEI